LKEYTVNPDAVFANALLPSAGADPLKYAAASPLQPLNALVPIDATLDGTVTLVTLVLLRKAELATAVTVAPPSVPGIIIVLIVPT
jgi:hypothetical protein